MRKIEEPRERVTARLFPEIAARILEMAERAEHSYTWVCIHLLEYAIEDRVNLLFGIVAKVSGFLQNLVRDEPPPKGKPTAAEAVVLDLVLPVELCKQIDAIAAGLRQSRADMVATLLTTIVDQQGWLEESINGKFGSKIQDALLGSKAGKKASVKRRVSEA